LTAAAWYTRCHADVLGENAATLIYGPNGFRVVKPGRFVAVRGHRRADRARRAALLERRPAGSLRQPEIATRRLLGKREALRGASASRRRGVRARRRPARRAARRRLPAAAGPPAPAAFVYAGELTQGGWIRGQAPAARSSARLGEQALSLDADGRFFAAFDRDAGPATLLARRLRDGRLVEAR
jgi:hypothetical protein